MKAISLLVGKQLEEVWVWYSLRLIFEKGTDPEPVTCVDLTEFALTDSEGEMLLVNVEQEPHEVGPVLGRLRKRVSAASINDSVLELEFEDGWHLTCSPHPSYESWHVHAGGLTVTCLPGGELLSW